MPTLSEEADDVLDWARRVPATTDELILIRSQIEMDALKVKALDALCMKFDTFAADFSNELYNTLHTALHRIA